MIQLLEINPQEALNQLLKNDNFINEISKSEKVSNFFLYVMKYLENASDIPKDLVDTLLSNNKFIQYLDDMPVFMQDKALDLFIKLSDKGYDILNSVGKFGDDVIEFVNAIAKFKPLKIITKLASTPLGKAAGKALNCPWIGLVIDGGFSAYHAYNDKSDPAYNHLGKSIAGGVIDAVFNVGPIDRALIGAQFGGPWGAAIGFGIGTLSQIAQFMLPDARDGVKDAVYGWIDDGEKVGKAIIEDGKEMMSSAGQAMGQAGKSISQAVDDFGGKAQNFIDNLQMPQLNWFG